MELKESKEIWKKYEKEKVKKGFWKKKKTKNQNNSKNNRKQIQETKIENK